MSGDFPYANRTAPRRLIGGITLSTLVPTQLEIGTLGFFVTLDGETAPYNIGLVTCHHVVAGKQDDSVYQPMFVKLELDPGQTVHSPWEEGMIGTPVVDPQKKDNYVGQIFQLPKKQDYPGTDYNGDLSHFYVDAAAVKLNIKFSSCCHSNCSGVSFPEKGDIGGLDKANTKIKANTIVGVRALTEIDQVTQTPVFKVGRTTGLTEGRIIAISEPYTNPETYPGHNTIKIEAVSSPNVSGPPVFSQKGDSGAALIDMDGNLVGLVMAGNDPNTPNVSYACHIMPVLNALKATAITSANPVYHKDNGAASSMLADVPTLIDGRPNMSMQLRARFRASGAGQRIGALLEQHRHEVLDLVNHNRRVTVVWHRSQGPAFLNRCIANARDSETRIPREIEGVTLEALLRNMAKSLADDGSATLRAAIERHVDELLAYARDLDSLHELMDHLAGEQPK